MIIPCFEGLLRGTFSVERSPLIRPTTYVLTESWIFDTMHRRAGGDTRPLAKGGPYGHSDAHKYCALASCGFGSRPVYTEPNPKSIRSTKIIAWRKAKAAKNRRYLEEHVYGKRPVAEMVHNAADQPGAG